MGILSFLKKILRGRSFAEIDGRLITYENCKPIERTLNFEDSYVSLDNSIEAYCPGNNIFIVPESGVYSVTFRSLGFNDVKYNLLKNRAAMKAVKLNSKNLKKLADICCKSSIKAEIVKLQKDYEISLNNF